ncbi:MAG: hypothetical protein JNJ58_06755 [Chitinophagaceae bacterium]|nr:hypothetical protein [Chitinophagaceae bacterium]
MKNTIIFSCCIFLLFACSKGSIVVQEAPEFGPITDTAPDPIELPGPESVAVLKKIQQGVPQYMIALQHKGYAIAFSVGNLQSNAGAPSPELIRYDLLRILGGQKAAQAIRKGLWSRVSSTGYCGEALLTSDVKSSITFTTGNHATRIGLYDMPDNTCPVMVVEIDGDKTKANHLPTAAELVQQGVIPASALSTNGGTLNVTDRILNRRTPQDVVTMDAYYGSSRRILLADQLTSTTHKITFYHTPYITPGTMTGTNTLGGIWYDDSTMTIGHFPIAQFEPVDEGISLQTLSDINFAFSYTPSGDSVKTWLGHTNTQFLNSLSLNIDGVPVTIKDLGPSTICNRAVLSVNGYCMASGQEVLTYTQSMEFTAEAGVETTYSFLWKKQGFIGSGYLPQLSVNNAVNTGLMNGISYLLTADDGKSYTDSTKEVSIINPLTHWKITCSSPSHTGKVFFEDRTGGTMNKIYFVKYFQDTVKVNDAFTTKVQYQFQKN